MQTFLFLKELLSPWEVMGCVLLFFAMLTLWLDDAPQEDESAAPADAGKSGAVSS